MKFLGFINVWPSWKIYQAAGVNEHTHELLTWHHPKEIAEAIVEGRIVAEFKVRPGDPSCFVARVR